MSKCKHVFLTGLMLILTIILTGWNDQVQSQEKYPTGPIDIIVPVTPGGSTDLSTRIIANLLRKKWGVPVNVVNKPGGNSVIGTLEVYRAAPNGYTMLGDNFAFVISGFYEKDLPFKILDRTFIYIHSEAPYLIAVPSNSPFKTLSDLTAEIKRNPEKIAYTSRGGGGVEFTVRQYYDAIGVDILKSKPVMSRGGSEAATLTAGGHVTFGASSASSYGPSISAGTVRPLLVTSKQRFPTVPDVPTATELGYPTITCTSWNGISGPPNLPAHIAEVWNKALEEIVRNPEYVAQLKNAAMVPDYYNLQTTRKYVTQELEVANKLFSK